MCFGTDENGYPRRLNQAVLGDIMARWATTTTTPEGPSELLALARRTAICALATYELMSVAVPAVLAGSRSRLA
jgi:hypothetical protein